MPCKSLSLKLRHYGSKQFHVTYFFKLTSSFSFPLLFCPLQKRNGLQMNQKMPTHGTFRSSPWALTWPTKSTNTNLLVVWYHLSEKLKMNAEHQVFLLTHQTSVFSSKRVVKKSTVEEKGWRWQWGVEDTFLFTRSSNQGLDRNPNWKGPPMCIPLMLLPCSWTLFYLLMYP